jgi:hypothetical protein
MEEKARPCRHAAKQNLWQCHVGGKLGIDPVMKRRLPNLLPALSLLLFVAAAGLCARSLWSGDSASVRWTRHRAGTLSSDAWDVISDGGGIVLRHTSVSSNNPVAIATIAGRRPPGLSWDTGSMPPGDLWGKRPTAAAVPSCYVYSLRTPSPGGAFTLRDLRVSYWVPCAALAVAPAVHFVTQDRRRRRLGAGRCGRCGYDLRATPDRCPECGATGATLREP